MENLPKIFLSYSWANKDIADQIDNDFKAVGISFIRDVRDAKYKDSIKEFMQKVRDTDFVVMLISDTFLKSVSCMYEVLELVKEKEFEKRLLQVILPGTNIYISEGRLDYIKYWESERITLEEKSKGSDLENLSEIAEDLKHIRNICLNIGSFLSTISNELSVSFEKLKNNNYRELLDYIGFTEKNLIEELLKIDSIEEQDKKDYAIDAFILQHTDYYAGYFLKAYYEKNFDKQILFYNKALKLNPTFVLAYYNRGIVYITQTKYELAIIDFTKAIELDWLPSPPAIITA